MILIQIFIRKASVTDIQKLEITEIKLALLVVCARNILRNVKQHSRGASSNLALTNASVVLLSFPMAQLGAGPRLPRPTASHISWLKDTMNKETISLRPFRCSVQRQNKTGDLWATQHLEIYVLAGLGTLWYELEWAQGEKEWRI